MVAIFPWMNNTTARGRDPEQKNETRTFCPTHLRFTTLVNADLLRRIHETVLRHLRMPSNTPFSHPPSPPPCLPLYLSPCLPSPSVFCVYRPPTLTLNKSHHSPFLFSLSAATTPTAPFYALTISLTLSLSLPAAPSLLVPLPLPLPAVPAVPPPLAAAPTSHSSSIHSPTTAA